MQFLSKDGIFLPLEDQKIKCSLQVISLQNSIKVYVINPNIKLK